MDNSRFQETFSSCRSTSDRITEFLRRAIISKEIKCGERLIEAKIAKELNVSITPVREAFSHLATQGLLTVYPYKGTYVTVITQKYVDDVVYIRKYLESAAIELSFASLDEQDAETLLSYCTLSDSLKLVDRIYDEIRYDVMFHSYFFEKSGNALLLELWQAIRNRIEFIQSYTKPVRQIQNYMYLRHGGMIDAIRKKDKALFLDVLFNHLDTSSMHMTFPADQA